MNSNLLIHAAPYRFPLLLKYPAITKDDVHEVLSSSSISSSSIDLFIKLNLININLTNYSSPGCAF